MVRSQKIPYITCNVIVDLFESGSTDDHGAVIPRYEQLLKSHPELEIVHHSPGRVGRKPNEA